MIARGRARAVVRLAALVTLAVVSIVHLGALLVEADDVAAPTKLLLVPLVGLWTLMASTRMRPLPRWLLLTGLALSWVGDIVLGVTLAAGLTAFLLAHVAYVATFVLVGRRRPSWWSLLLAPWFVGLLLLVAPGAGAMIVPVAIYGLVLAAMAVSARAVGGLALVGGTLFVASDSVLSLRLFTDLAQPSGYGVLVMGTYVAAQLCIAMGVVRRA